MAALAPTPYQSTSSISTDNSAPPSKKQEQLAAGRRRLEEFKRKKAAEKGKKTSAVPAAATAAAVSDQPAQNVVEHEQLSALPAIADSSVSTSKQVESNGYASENFLSNDLDSVTTKNSIPSELLAASSALHKESTGSILSVSKGILRSSGELFRKDPQLTAVPSGGGVNDGSSIRESNSNNAREQTSGKADGESVFFPGQDSKNTNRTGIPPTPPLGASRPLFVPAPPPARKEIFGVATGHWKAETTTTKNSIAVPLNKTSSQGLENSFNPASQKSNGGSLVMLDRKLVPSNSAARQAPFPQSASEPEQESTSARSQLPAWMPPNEAVRTDNQTDGIASTSASSNISYSLKVKSENENGSGYPPAMSSSFVSTLPLSSVGSKTSVKLPESLLYPSVSESMVPKHLPLPPQLSRPPISRSTFKPDPFVPSSSFRNVSGPASSSSTSTLLSSTAPSISTSVDTVLPPRLSTPPSTLQFPGPLSNINAIHENGKKEVFVNPFTAVLPPVSTASVGEIRTQQVKVAEPMDQSRELWPLSSGGDEFAMLEQHIEDLTQEKFSLQRGLDAARALAKTLAKENSALTEDFNNQGALVNDLKVETERQEGEIRAQAVVVKNMKIERDKAVQDCKSAVERSQALASEVIALEEKVLRARSQELELQREMEVLSTETESQKRLSASLEKDQENLTTLIEALQEEKGLLQTQIRKAMAAGGSAGDLSNSKSSSLWTSGAGVHAKADASTSTTDDSGTFGRGSAAAGPVSATHNPALGFEPLEQQRRLPLIIPSLPSRPLQSPSHDAGQASGSFSLTNEGGSTSHFFPTAAAGNFSGRGLKLGPMSSVLPPDQAASIGNINTLITELADEKEALVKTLRAESVGAAELRSLNAELSHKLEVQTQRLELAVAQSMSANDGTPRVGSIYAESRMAPEYIDEGDEVVDRVLGWIMQLFPSGSSRRKRL